MMQQYYIPPLEESKQSVWDVFLALYSLAFGDVAMWVYGASFGKVLFFFLVLYMMFVYCFVVAIYLVDRYYANSMCINVPEEGGKFDRRAMFEFAFELSWTVSVCILIVFQRRDHTRHILFVNGMRISWESGLK